MLRSARQEMWKLMVLGQADPVEQQGRQKQVSLLHVDLLALCML